MVFGRPVVFLVLFLTIALSPSSDRLAAVSITQAWVVIPVNQNQNAVIRNRAVACKSPSAYAPSVATWHCSGENDKKNVIGNSCLHSSVVSPRRADVRGSIEDGNMDDNAADGENEDLDRDLQLQQEKLSQLFTILKAEPKNLLRFQNEVESGVRGIYLNCSIKSGEVVLKVPLDSCLIDDKSPSWLHDEVKNDPHRWATRLAASWIDMHLKDKELDNEDIESSQQGHRVWSSLLPDTEYVRASLPVHWPETTLSNARSTALELAVDSTFFARAEAVSDLVRGIQRSPYAEQFSKEEDEVAMHRCMNELAHRALDLVQTRSCRLEDGSGDTNCRRAMAPIFDFINHGSRNTAGANACFALEEEQYLVVRSMQDISQDKEVKIDYGASARPAWKCLLSYGFVPEYKRTVPEAEEGENLAEVYMKGVRYEVADDSVPIDMVADANPRPWSDEEDDELPSNESVLTPDIALRISERIADAAFYLLLEPEQILNKNGSNEDEDPDSTPFEIISKQLAASLRWSQHRILLTCAAGLTHFAKEHAKEEESSYQ